MVRAAPQGMLPCRGVNAIDIDTGELVRGVAIHCGIEPRWGRQTKGKGKGSVAPGGAWEQLFDAFHRLTPRVRRLSPVGGEYRHA